MPKKVWKSLRALWRQNNKKPFLARHRDGSINFVSGPWTCPTAFEVERESIDPTTPNLGPFPIDESAQEWQLASCEVGHGNPLVARREFYSLIFLAERDLEAQRQKPKDWEKLLPLQIGEGGTIFTFSGSKKLWLSEKAFEFALIAAAAHECLGFDHDIYSHGALRQLLGQLTQKYGAPSISITESKKFGTRGGKARKGWREPITVLLHRYCKKYPTLGNRDIKRKFIKAVDGKSEALCEELEELIGTKTSRHPSGLGISNLRRKNEALLYSVNGKEKSLQLGSLEMSISRARTFADDLPKNC